VDHNAQVATLDRIGRYAVPRRLGAGSFATVWLAHDDQLDSPVAIKVLAENWTDDTDVRRRFIEEGRFLRRVESPYVVAVYDAGELEDGRPYLVMTLADGGTLGDRVLVGDSIERSDAVAIVSQVAAGLGALRERGVLHRDVKPPTFRPNRPADTISTPGPTNTLSLPWLTYCCVAGRPIHTLRSRPRSPRSRRHRWSR